MTQNTKQSKTGLIFAIFVIAIVFCAFGYSYFKLTQVNISLARTINHLKTAITTLQQGVTNLNQDTQKARDLSAQQEQLMNEWRAAQKGDLNKWYLAEAQYLVKLANNHLQLDNDAGTALLLLQRASQIMQNISDANSNVIHQSILNAIAKLQAYVQLDTSALYARLNTINAQIEQLPIPATPLSSSTSTVTSTTENLPWWKATLELARQALSKIVIVRYNASNNMPLVMPEEKSFLYQNLHAQLENAMWAALRHNNTVYQASLMRAINWTQYYFVQDAAPTKVILQNLQQLAAMDIQPPAVDLATTLQLFAKALQ